MTPYLQFICRVCGLVYDEALGDPDSGLPPGTRFADIPDDWACPICGVGKADFEPHAPAAAVARAEPAAAVVARGDAGVVIVGGGRAAWQLVQALRERDAALPITLVCACSGDVYDKPLLSVAAGRGLALDTLVREGAAQAARRLGVRLLAGTQAVAIDAPRRRLRTTRGTLRYRQLVLAHGAVPLLPAALPADRVWRVNDLAAYVGFRRALGTEPRRVLVVGAGLVGCELANDLAQQGHGVTLLDAQPLPLATQLPPEVGRRLLQAWSALPIQFIGNTRVADVERQGDALCARLDDGRLLAVDQVLAATGLRTAGRLAASAGLAFDHVAGGIVVDARSGATSQPHIHALGDCVVVDGTASRFIDAIVQQAARVAAALTGTAPPATPATPAPLRVKTHSLAIHASGDWAGRGGWTLERDDAQELRLARVDIQGRRLAQVVASAA